MNIVCLFFNLLLRFEVLKFKDVTRHFHLINPERE